MTPNASIKRIFAALVAALILTFTLASPVVAQTYNCGAYGADSYNQNCPTSSAAPSGSSSKPAATTFDTVAAGDKIVLNDFPEYTTTAGKDLALAALQVIYFNVVVNGVIEEHTATITEIGADYVVITFGPLVSVLRLDVGQTVNADVTGDGQSDIQIKLTAIKDGLAYLTFRQYTPDAQPIPDKTVASETTIAPSKGFSGWKLVGIVFAIFLILMALWWAVATRRRRRRSDNDIIHP